MSDDDPLLAARDLKNHYPVTEGPFRREVGSVRAVDGVSFTLDRGETLGLVGESGCGKSTTARTLLGLEEPTGGQVRFDGEVVFDGDAGTGVTGERRKRFRRDAQIVFQDPTSTFDPRMTVGESVTEPLRIHGLADREHRREVGEDLLVRVGLDTEDYDRYPHAFSGGQRQRLALARALILNPRLLVADEPVSALDAAVTSEILSLLADLQADLGLALVVISHDLRVVREVCDRVAVMYLGEIVEVSPTEDLFADPRHPYTRALLSAIPEPDPNVRSNPVELSGTVPSAANPPSGCRFHTRCPSVIQPASVDLDQETWRRVVDLRVTLAEGIDADALVRVHAEADESESDLTDRQVRRALRAEFDLPEPIDDEAVEEAVTDALDAVARGDEERALDRLAAACTTPCEEHAPALRSVGDGREVACHLHHPPDGVEIDGDGESAASRGDD